MKYYLAPLAGFTDAPFRKMCAEGGADLTYTEMVSAAGLAHGSSPTRHLMETMEGEGPVSCQIFGAKETDIACATREVDKIRERFVEINLNAGCPMQKVTREGAGSKLIEDPSSVYKLLKAMTDNTSLPVTLKTRLGPHPQQTNVFELIDAAEKAGAKGIILHGRYTSQCHGGTVHLETLAEAVSRTSLPITGNGSIVDAKTAAEMTRTGVAALMIGRAALADPEIFRKLKGESQTLNRFELCEKHLRYLLEFRKQLVREFPHDHLPSEDGYASVKMHVHLFRYFNGLPGAAALRARLNSIRTLSEIEEIVSSYRDCSVP